MSKKKICFITSLPGSARSFLSEPIKNLKPHFEIHYIGNFSSLDEISGIGADVCTPIPIERKQKIIDDFKTLLKLYRHFRKEKYYAVHAITRKATLLTGIASFFARVPHRIKTFTGQVWATMSGIKRSFYKALDKLDVLLYTDLLVDGESQRQYLISEGIMNENTAKVLANGSICGVDTTRFKASEQIRQHIRQDLKYENEDIVFIFLGRLKKEKGISELLDAFNKIVVARPKSKLLLVGTDEENYQKSISEFPNLTEGENIIFYGRTPEPQKLLQAGDIFVLPTYREGFGLAVLEASCLGLPVICSDTYGVMDAMENDITGLRCKTADSMSLLECMKKLYDNPHLRKELGENGQVRVKTKFSREILSDAWLNFYKSL